MKNYTFTIYKDDEFIKGKIVLKFDEHYGTPNIFFKGIEFQEERECLSSMISDASDIIKAFVIDKLNNDFSYLNYSTDLFINLRTKQESIEENKEEE